MYFFTKKAFVCFLTSVLFVSSGTPTIIGQTIGFITDFISLRQGTLWQNNPYFTYLERKNFK